VAWFLPFPPLATRLERGVRLSLLCLSLSSLPLTVALSLLLKPWKWIVPGTLVGLIVILVLLHVVASRRAMRMLRRQKFLICLRCQYPLADLPLAGHCPECGRAYSRSALKITWCRQYGLDARREG
jgi:hypothetical protein